MIGMTALLALGGMALGQIETEADRYVPATGWHDDECAASFYERWYGNQLRAMGEPRLSAPSHLDGFRRRFRLLVLPNYQSAYAYRIDERADGGVVLRWVRLDGAGGYAPGEIDATGIRMLRRGELGRFTAALEAAALRSRPRDDRREDVQMNADGSETIRICLHATHYVFELLEAGGRHYISRRSCDLEEPLRALVRALHEIKRPPLARDIRDRTE